MDPRIEQPQCSIWSFLVNIIFKIITVISNAYIQSHQHQQDIFPRYRSINDPLHPLTRIHEHIYQHRRYRFHHKTSHKSTNDDHILVITNRNSSNKIRVTQVGKQTNNQIPSAVYHEHCLDVDALALLQELNENLRWQLNPIVVYNFICNKKRDDQYIFMVKHNLELTDSEIIAISSWSSSEQLTKKYHVDCGNKNEYQWKLFIKSLTNGVKKICAAAIINDIGDNSLKIFPSLPTDLYRGTKIFDQSSKTWHLDTILSFTTSESVAESFAALSEYNKKETSYILNIINVKTHLLNGELIAAPINWLSSYDYEHEWVVIPSATFTVNRNDKVCVPSTAPFELSLVGSIF